MKKISLKNLNSNGTELLSREQLKNVSGGFNGGRETGNNTEADCQYNPNCEGGCQLGNYCSTCCVA